MPAGASRGAQAAVAGRYLFPENVVFRDGHVVAFIDVAVAAPGRPMWDLAVAAQEWGPLHAPGARLAHPDDLDGVRRAGRLARAYGVEPQQARELVDVIAEERAHPLADVRAQAAAGPAPWATSWPDTDGEGRAAADDAWLDRQRPARRAASRGPVSRGRRDAAGAPPRDRQQRTSWARSRAGSRLISVDTCSAAGPQSPVSGSGSTSTTRWSARDHRSDRRCGVSDVVIVGGGIAGSSLAILLARGGVDVTVLERTTVYEDRVRGETMPPWGYRELVLTDLLDVFLRAEGLVAQRYASYGDTMAPDVAEATAIDASAVVPGAAGSVNLSHPGACQALIDEAASAGAHVLRGVRGIAVKAAEQPEISFRTPDGRRTLRPRLVVGADGRSSVVRKQIGVELERSGVRTFASGVLLDGVEKWPRTTNGVGTWDDVYYLVFPRGEDRVRLYLLWDRDQPQRFAGPQAPARMVEQVAALGCFPEADWFATARPVSPVASYPMEDTWSDRPYAPGVVLVGDAAGWNDPVIGQGLSIAVRDVRLVAAALLGTTDWSPAVFEDYTCERAERMRRLRATAEAVTRLRCDFTPEGKERRRAASARFAADPAARLPIAASLVGPEALPPESFTREAADRMLALH